MTATTALRSEHDTILAVIACLRAACQAAAGGGEFDAETFRKGVEFIRGYADAWHHAKEEVHLFPALEAMGMPREGGPVGVMLHEHEIGRSYVAGMADNLDAASGGDEEAREMVVRHALGYADLLEAHIQKENGILFEMADRMLPPDEQRRLEDVYRSAIPDGADEATGARFEELAAALCQRWKIDPVEAARSGQGGFGCQHNANDGPFRRAPPAAMTPACRAWSPLARRGRDPQGPEGNARAPPIRRRTRRPPPGTALRWDSTGATLRGPAHMEPAISSGGAAGPPPTHPRLPRRGPTVPSSQ